MAVVPMTIKITFALMVLALIVFIIGFASPYWFYLEIGAPQMPGRGDKYRVGHINYGLWTVCEDSVEWIYEHPNYSKATGRVIDECWRLSLTSHITDTLRATQFFETVALLAVVASFILLVVTVCLEACQQRKVLPVLSAVLCLGSAVSIIIGTIIYGSDDTYQRNLSWAFAFTVVSGIIFIIPGILIIIGAVLKK